MNPFNLVAVFAIFFFCFVIGSGVQDEWVNIQLHEEKKWLKEWATGMLLINYFGFLTVYYYFWYYTLQTLDLLPAFLSGERFKPPVYTMLIIATIGVISRVIFSFKTPVNHVGDEEEKFIRYAKNYRWADLPGEWILETAGKFFSVTPLYALAVIVLWAVIYLVPVSGAFVWTLYSSRYD